jgi:hypothetical protein
MDHLSTSNFISDSEIDHAVRPLTSLIIDRASIPSGDAPRQRRKRTNISQNNSAETSSRAFTVTPSIADRSSIPSGTFQRQRAERHKPIEKVDQVIELLVRLNLSLGEFLLYAIKLPPKKLDPKKGKPWTASHTTMVSKFLKGDSDITMDHIINIIYNHPYGKAPTSSDEHDHMFSPDIPPSSLHFAQPILSTWAVHLVQSQAEKQAKVLAKSDGGLHMRASSILRLNNTTAKTRRHEGQLSWGRISEFSIGGLEAVMKQNAPLLWSLVQGITGREEGKGSKYRPANVVRSDCLMLVVLGRLLTAYTHSGCLRSHLCTHACPILTCKFTSYGNQHMAFRLKGPHFDSSSPEPLGTCCVIQLYDCGTQETLAAAKRTHS